MSPKVLHIPVNGFNRGYSAFLQTPVNAPVEVSLGKSTQGSERITLVLLRTQGIQLVGGEPFATNVHNLLPDLEKVTRYATETLCTELTRDSSLLFRLLEHTSHHADQTGYQRAKRELRTWLAS